MRNAGSAIDAARPWLWAALTIVGLVVAFLAAFVVAVAVVARAIFPDAGAGTLRLDLAGFLLLSGAFGIGAVLVAGRVAFGSWVDARPRHIVLPAIGVALAIGLELGLHEWARLSIGYYDWDFIGWTAVLSFAVVVMAVAWFGVLVAPPAAGAPPRIGLGLSAILVLLVVASNAPGLGDGIESRSMPLAILVGLAAMYAIGAVITTARGGSPR
jgi:hypothetical protein